jgi:hypothetical protein
MGCEDPERLLFPGPPSKTLLSLATMHSSLSQAVTPFIWREVSLLFGGDNDRELYRNRLETATKPHIAPHVRALFVSFAWLGNDKDNNTLLIGALTKLTGLRSMCLGGFQGYTQFKPDPRLASAIRQHCMIDTIVLSRIKEASDLIADGEYTRSWNIDLENCLYGTDALIGKANKIRRLTLQQVQPEDGMKQWIRENIWASLRSLDLGRYPDCSGLNEGILLASLKVGSPRHISDHI